MIVVLSLLFRYINQYSTPRAEQSLCLVPCAWLVPCASGDVYGGTDVQDELCVYSHI